MEKNLDYVKCVFNELTEDQVSKIVNEKAMPYVIYDVAQCDNGMAITVCFANEKGADIASKSLNELSFCMRVDQSIELLRVMKKL